MMIKGGYAGLPGRVNAHSIPGRTPGGFSAIPPSTSRGVHQPGVKPSLSPPRSGSNGQVGSYPAASPHSNSSSTGLRSSSSGAVNSHPPLNSVTATAVGGAADNRGRETHRSNGPTSISGSSMGTPGLSRTEGVPVSRRSVGTYNTTRNSLQPQKSSFGTDGRSLRTNATSPSGCGGCGGCANGCGGGGCAGGSSPISMAGVSRDHQAMQEELSPTSADLRRHQEARDLRFASLRSPGPPAQEHPRENIGRVARQRQPGMQYSPYPKIKKILLEAAIDTFQTSIGRYDKYPEEHRDNEMFKLFSERWYQDQVNEDTSKIIAQKNNWCSLQAVNQVDQKIKHLRQTLDNSAQTIPLAEFICELLQSGKFEVSVFLVAIRYLKAFEDKAGFRVHQSTWRPLLVTSLLVADKMWEDKPVKNSALVGLFPILTCGDIFNMEINFVKLFNYEMENVTEEAFQEECSILLHSDSPNPQITRVVEKYPNIWSEEDNRNCAAACRHPAKPAVDSSSIAAACSSLSNKRSASSCPPGGVSQSGLVGGYPGGSGGNLAGAASAAMDSRRKTLGGATVSSGGGLSPHGSSNSKSSPGMDRLPRRLPQTSNAVVSRPNLPQPTQQSTQQSSQAHHRNLTPPGKGLAQAAVCATAISSGLQKDSSQAASNGQQTSSQTSPTHSGTSSAAAPPPGNSVSSSTSTGLSQSRSVATSAQGSLSGRGIVGSRSAAGSPRSNDGYTPPSSAPIIAPLAQSRSQASTRSTSNPLAATPSSLRQNAVASSSMAAPPTRNSGPSQYSGMASPPPRTASGLCTTGSPIVRSQQQQAQARANSSPASPGVASAVPACATARQPIDRGAAGRGSALGGPYAGMPYVARRMY